MTNRNDPDSEINQQDSADNRNYVGGLKLSHAHEKRCGRKFRVSFAESLELAKRPDAHLLLLANGASAGFDFDVTVIRFASRAALEAFNVKAGLRAVVKTIVPRGCVIYGHQVESLGA